MLLDDYGVLDGASRPVLDDIVELAARHCGAPMAAITVVDDVTEYFIASRGMILPEQRKHLLFGEHVVRTRQPLLVRNAEQHEFFGASPLVTGSDAVSFYYAVPLVSPEGVVIGTLAIMNRRTMEVDSEARATLATLAAQVIVELELNRRCCSLLKDKATNALHSIGTDSEDDFRKIFEALPTPIVILDPLNFHIVAVNEELLRTTGARREDLVGMLIFDAFPADPTDPEGQKNVDFLRNTLTRVRNTGRAETLQLHRYSIPRRKENGGGFDERYWMAATTPVFSHDGRLKYIVHRPEDVTRFVRRNIAAEGESNESSLRTRMAETDFWARTEQLQRANEHLQLAQRVANIGSWELKLPEFERTWSDEVYRILGIAPGAVPTDDESMMEYVHPEDRERLSVARARALEGGDIPEIEHRIVRTDGSVRYVIQRARLVRDADGKPKGLYGTMQDVTEHRRVEQEIRVRARQQEAVSRLGRMALRETDLSKVWQEATQLVAEVLEVEYSKVLKRLSGEEKMQLMAGVGWQAGLVGTTKVDIGPDSQAGYALQVGESVVVHDLRSDARFRNPALLREHKVVSGVSVIIQDEDGPWGVLGAHTTRHREFTQDDVNFVQSVANTIAEANRRASVERALRGSERKFHMIVDTALDAVIAIDAESRIIEWNPQAEKTFGWKSAEAIGRPMPELIIPEAFREDHYVGLRRFLQTGEGPLVHRRVEVPALHRKGHEFPVELSIAPLEMDGRTTFSAFLRDITARKRAEIAIRENEERFRIVAKATADTVWDWNLVTDSVWWNEGMRLVFGYRPEEVEKDSQSFLSRIHPDDKRDVEDLVRSVVEGDREEWSSEYRFRRRDGSYAHVEVRAYVVRNELGNTVRMVGGMNDVSEAREREKRIAEQAALLDRAHDAIIVRDVQDRVIYWNRSAERIYGYTEAEAMGRNLHALLDEPAEVIAAAKARLLEKGDWIGEIMQRDRGGRKIIAEVTWSLVTDKRGLPAEVMAVNTDITERRALEEQLRQSQRLESVGQLTGGVAHDFNNLLTVILGNAELLVDQLPRDNRLYKLAELTRVAALRGADLTHRLLAFARRQALEPQVIDINELIEGMNDMLRRTLLENIDIEFVQNDVLWCAFADPGQLESVILNLCINAKDAMREGGKLTIETANAELDEDYAAHNSEVTAGEYVMIAVSDTGCGIRQEDIGHVFDPFFTTKEKGKGTGLGLSMAYGFAKQSHGHIKIYSEPGQGTTVRIYLPRAMQPEERKGITDPSSQDLSGSETVLVVEDNDLVREHAESQLTGYGYEVLSARNGPEALEILRSKDNVDLLFTDVIMSGGLNGRELAETARRLRPRLKVLYTSGYTENAIVHHGQLDRGVHLLQKPYQRRDLARKVRGVLNENTDSNAEDRS